MKKRNRRRLVIVVLALTLVALLRVLTTRPDPLADVGRACFLRPHTEPYWSADYCREFANAPDNGRWVHLDHGRRYTVPVVKPTIYMFGNSTMWGTYVLDADTIPSQLQALIGDSFRVENRGQPGLNVAGALDELYSIHLKPQDVVVFYDGEADSGGTRDTYTRYLLMARDTTTAARALFFHALQPTIHTGTLRPDEIALVDATAKAFDLTRPERGWGASMADLQPINIGADFTHALDAARANGAVLYVDPGHLNAEGNAIIARLIYNELTIY